MRKYKFIIRIRNLFITFLIIIFTIKYVKNSIESMVTNHLQDFKNDLIKYDYMLNSTINYPYISGTNLFFYSDYVYVENYNNLEPVDKLRNGDVLFVKMTLLENFFKKIFPQIKVKFVLITYNYDEYCEKRFQKYIENNKIISWFSSNPSFSHPKLVPLPLGFQSVYIESFNSLISQMETKLKLSFIGSLKDREKVMFLQNFSSKNLIPWKNRKNLIYANFRIHSGDPGGREILKKTLKKFDQVFYADTNLNYSTYMYHLGNSKFVICPKGYGLDSHRFYESILMG
jgi:hypothetical protein